MSPAWPRWVCNAVIVLAAGWALSALGPFGTYTDFTPAERYGYWIGLTVAMWLQIEAAWLAVRRLWPNVRLPLAVNAALAAALGAIPTTFEVAYLEGLLRVAGVLTPRSMIETYGSVLIIAIGLFVPLRLLEGLSRPAPAASPSAPSSPTALAPSAQAAQAAPAGGLPPELTGAVIALTAEDHYLRVYTTGGDRLIHFRLSDAVRLLGDRGVQVHRSWWVAKDAVAGVERDGDRQVLRLEGGLRAPVSRTFSVVARNAGLFAGD